MRQVVAAIALGAVGVLGFAVSGTLLAGTLAVSDRTIFCTEFVPNAEADTNYSQWRVKYPSESSRWSLFRDRVCVTKINPEPPAMMTAKGRALVAGGRMALDEVLPPPTTTTTTTTTTPPPPPSTGVKANIWVSP